MTLLLLPTVRFFLRAKFLTFADWLLGTSSINLRDAFARVMNIDKEGVLDLDYLFDLHKIAMKDLFFNDTLIDKYQRATVHYYETGEYGPYVAFFKQNYQLVIDEITASA
jgi:hypothetical protein